MCIRVSIVSATGNNTALYKEYYNKLINTRESPNIEDLASIYYCLRSFQYFKDGNEKNDAFLYKNALKKLNSDLLFFTFNNDDTNDDMNTNEKMSVIKSTLAKFILGFDIDNDRQLAAISRYVLNGHISSLRKKEIPVYISGSEQDVEQFKKLFPNAIKSITNLKYPNLVEKKSDDIILHAPVRELSEHR